MMGEEIPFKDESGSGNEDDKVIDLAKDNDHQQPSQSIFTDESGNLKFVNIIVRYPCLIFCLILGLCFVFTFGLVYLFDGNPFTEDTNEYDIFDVRSIAYDSLRLAKEEVSTTLEGSISVRTNTRRAEELGLQEELGDITYWIYEAKTEDGLFTEEGIPKMREAEATVLENIDYPDYCYVVENDFTGQKECEKPLSVMNIYYASSWNSTTAQDIISQLSPEKIQIYNAISPCIEYGVLCNVLSNFTNEDKVWVETTNNKIMSMMFYWDGKGDLNPDIKEVTTFIASMNALNTKQPAVNFFVDEDFSLSNPVTMYSRSILYWGELLNGTQTTQESESKLKSFILKNLLKKWNEITQRNNNDQVQSYFFMGALIWDIILYILLFDGVKAVGSFVVVFFYLRYMLGSWFLTAVGMFEIFMSVPLSWFFFSYVFQIKYFSALNVLCIFIVMAIGADDIFVFMDAYKQSANKGKDIVTSLETRMSWVFRRSGSAMLLTSATTCSAFLVTLTSPIAGTRSFGIFAAFVILFDYILVMSLFCTAVVIYHNRFESKSFCCNCTWTRCEPTSTEAALARDDTEEVVEEPISRFFKEKLGPFLLKGRNRIIVAVVLIAWIVISSIYTSKLEPTQTAEQFLDDNHPVQKAATILSSKFPKTQEDETSAIHFVWGLADVDRSGVNQLLDPNFIGKPSFVTDFSFNEECQTKMLEACNTLRTDEAFEEFILRKNGLRDVSCFVEELGAFNFFAGAGDCTQMRSQLWTGNDWQVAPAELSTTMESFAQTKSCYGEGLQGDVTSYYSDSMGWDGSALRYAGISVQSSLLDPRQIRAEDEVRYHYDKFIQFAEDLDKTMADVCQSNTIVTDLDQKFVFMNNQRIYRTSAVSGSMLGVAIAFVVLFISTRKLHITIFACACILSVLVGVIGSITMIGWTLGTIEAILISILAGFSVDYVIHLAHAYVHAEGDTEERVIEAFGDMGISVFSGMLTSVVASIPLFFCTLTFFAKFGTFLCLTIALSWIFANFGFMCLLAQFKIPMSKKCL